MSMPPAPREEEDRRPSATQAPVVVSQGLTYRDLQRAVFLGFGLFLIYRWAGAITTLLLFFLLVFILAAVLNGLVARLERRGVPRIASAVGVAFLFLALLGLIGWLALPPLLDEVGTLFKNLPEKQQRLEAQYQDLVRRYPAIAAQLPDPEQITQQVTPTVSRLVGMLGRYTFNLLAAIFSLFLLLVLVIYTVAHPQPLIAGLLGATPDRYRSRMESALRRILEQLKNWAVGSLILGVIIGVVSGIGLKLIGVPYALLFGVIAGLGELIPNVGPILSAIPPVLVALTNDPVQALYVVILFALIQQFENNIIVPWVMGQSLNLHPVSVTFTVLVMGFLFGVLGAVLAVPVCAIVKVCWEEFYLIPRRTDMEALHAVAEDIVQHGSDKGQDESGLEQVLDEIVPDDRAPARGRTSDVEPPEESRKG